MFTDYDDDSKYYCEYCGEYYYPEVGPPGHICSKMLEELEKETAEREEKYKRVRARPKRRFRLIIDVECLDDDMCEDMAVDRVILESKIYKKQTMMSSDELLGFRARLIKQKI